MTDGWVVTTSALVLAAVLAGAIPALLRGVRGAVLAVALPTLLWAVVLGVGLAVGAVRAVPAVLLYLAGAVLLSVAAAYVLGPATVSSGALVLSTLLWPTLLLVPLGVGLFGGPAAWLVLDARVADYGGALLFAVPLSALYVVRAVLALEPPEDSPHARRPLLATSSMWIAAVVWMIGVELRIDEVTPVVLLAAVVVPGVSAVGWAVVQLIRRHRIDTVGVCSGATAGVMATLAAAPSVDLLWGAVLGGVTGTSSAIVAYSAHRAAWRPGSLRNVLALLPVPAAIGVAFLGLFGLERGFVYSGSLDPVIAQFGAVLGVVLWSGVAALIVALPLLIAQQVRRSRAARASA
ncbi:ammonium transporter family [Diaminobutyricimonas aerilata]|uniref:Ammonium transporter family n=1 Tax=Diaminobutyricimonas aerilata TaxID=1162967 RepID=A0A2M9CKD3_9MICO|nr:ammonium transporter [Diaminobutyricimonas aerilata]PJJ72338.1 ammonium transporter family [Diaminobutyricimonas aerilata]